jgi:NAD(P)-dependent dehydrogenase (short-subunit alcohol dehydrogenase family)
MRVSDPNRRDLLEGKVALLSGGAGGLGLATARLFLKEGARVVLADRDTEAVAATVSRLDDVQASSVAGDPAREDDVVAALDTVVQRHGRLDAAFAGHVRGVFLACRYALPVMSDGGSVVIVSGVAGLRGGTGLAVAAAVQHAQVGLMRSAAAEVAGRGIRVNTIHPGPDVRPGAPVPLGRPPQPDEIAKSGLYRASPMSSATTATTLVCDGGLTADPSVRLVARPHDRVVALRVLVGGEGGVRGLAVARLVLAHRSVGRVGGLPVAGGV